MHARCTPCMCVRASMRARVGAYDFCSFVLRPDRLVLAGHLIVQLERKGCRLSVTYSNTHSSHSTCKQHKHISTHRSCMRETSITVLPDNICCVIDFILLNIEQNTCARALTHDAAMNPVSVSVGAVT